MNKKEKVEKIKNEKEKKVNLNRFELLTTHLLIKLLPRLIFFIIELVPAAAYSVLKSSIRLWRVPWDFVIDASMVSAWASEYS